MDNTHKENTEELQDICSHYLAYMEEEAVDTSHLKQFKDVHQILF